MSTKQYYLRNEDLLKELEKSRAQDKLTDTAVNMFYTLIDRIQRKLFYKDENVKQDCKASAMLVIVENWHKFDQTKYDNAFAYFTRVAMNGLAYSWNRNEARPIHIPINSFINNDVDE
jgi:hypothetical protein